MVGWWTVVLGSDSTALGLVSPGQWSEGGRGEGLVGDERLATMSQAQTVVLPLDQSSVDGVASLDPVHLLEHLPYCQVMKTGWRLDPDLDQELYQQSSVIGKVLLNLKTSHIVKD